MTAPDFVQLQDAPQLAIVAAVDTLLDLLAAALLAAHPEILGDHHRDSPAVWLADVVASDARRLQALLNRYRAAVDEEQFDNPSPRLAPID